MPKIHTLTFPLHQRILDADVAHAVSVPLDNLPLVTSIPEGVELLGRANRGSTFYFRIADDPSVVVIWKNYGTAAVIHTLWRRRLVETNLILLGDVLDDSFAVKGTTGLMATEIEQITKAARPTVVRFSLPTDEGIVGLLPLVLFVPIFCEINNVE